MKISSIQDLAHQHMLNILGAGASGQSTQTSGKAGSISAIGGATAGSLSPFAQMLAQLQQVEQGNAGQYSKLTQQISTNLSAAASSAQIRGNSSLAKQLTTLSKDFATASQTGQMPNVSDLAATMSNPAASSAIGSASGGSTPASAPHLNPVQIIGHVLGINI